MDVLFDVFVTDPIVVDADVFNLWVKGHSAREVLEIREKSFSSYAARFKDDGSPQNEHFSQSQTPESGSQPAPSPFVATKPAVVAERQKQSPEVFRLRELLLRDTIDQYRTFEMLEHFLEKPALLSKQMLCHLPHDARAQIIASFYSFDDEVIRLLIGKRLSTKLRKDLDEISEETGITARSCRRQFDCLRRVFSFFEDKNFQGNIFKELVDLFYFPHHLAWRYTCILFLLRNHFHTHPTKRKMAFLTLFDLEFFAQVMMSQWLPNRKSPLDDSATAASFSATRRGSPSARSLASIASAMNNPWQSLTADEANRVEDAEKIELSNAPRAAGDISNSSLLPTTIHHAASQRESRDSTSIRHYLRERDRRHSPAANPLSELSLFFWRSGRMDAIAQLPSDMNVATVLSHFAAGSGLDLDPTFLSRLKEIRNAFFSDRNAFDDGVSRILVRIAEHNSSFSTQVMEIKVKLWFKSLLNLGAGLTTQKDARDFLEEFVTMVSDLLKETSFLGQAELALLFESSFSALPPMDQWSSTSTSATVVMSASGAQLLNSNTQSRKFEILKDDWRRFVLVCQQISLQIEDRIRRAQVGAIS